MPGLVDDPFDWKITKDDRVIVSRNGHQVAIVAGSRGAALAHALRGADEEKAQHLLARATGNYKRGNEHGPVRPY